MGVYASNTDGYYSGSDANYNVDCSWLRNSDVCVVEATPCGADALKYK